MSEKKYISIFALLAPLRRTYGHRAECLRPSSAAPAALNSQLMTHNSQLKTYAHYGDAR